MRVEELTHNTYYWAVFKEYEDNKAFIVFYYKDGFSGSIEIHGSEDIFSTEEFRFLKKVEPYEG